MSWSDTSSLAGDGGRTGQSTTASGSRDDESEMDRCVCGAIWAPPHVVFCRKCGRKRLDKLEELRSIEHRLEMAWRAAEGSVISNSMEELKRTQEQLDEAKRLAEVRLRAVLEERSRMPVDIPPAYRTLVEQIERDGWDKVAWAKDFTLLHWAAKKNKPELVARFLQQGANPYQKDALGKSAFDYANEVGSDASITQLVVHIPAGIPENYVAAIQKLDQVGWEQMLFAKGHTLLHWAAKRDRPELVARFLRQGGDPYHRDESGRSAFDYAIAAGNDKALVQMLAYFLPEMQVQRLFTLKNSGWDAMQWENGVTLLHFGAEKGNLELCKYLVKVEADPNSQDAHGRTPLQLSSDLGHADVCQFFQEQLQSRAAAERLRQVEAQAAQLKEAMQRLEAEKLDAERAATQRLADLAVEKERAEREAAEKAKKQAELEAQQKMEEAVKAVERTAQERVHRLTLQVAEEKKAAEKRATIRVEAERAQVERDHAEKLAAEKRRLDMQMFNQTVHSHLANRLYRELYETLQAGRHDLETSEEGRKRFHDVLHSVGAHLGEQIEDARKIVRAAKAHLPGRLDPAKFDAGVVHIARGLDALCRVHAEDLLGDVTAWRKSLLADCTDLLAKMSEDAEAALGKWLFHRVLQTLEDVTNVLSEVAGMEERCDEAHAKLQAKFKKSVDALDADLAGMIVIGPTANSPFTTAAVEPVRIDELFSGLRRCCDSQVEFGDILRRLTKVLEVRVGEVYGAVRMAVQRGDMEAAEAYMQVATALQTSETVTSATVYTHEMHTRFLQEALLNRNCARRDPSGFNKRLNALMATDPAIYAKSTEPLRQDLLTCSSGLEHDIKTLAMGDEQKLETIAAGLTDMHWYAIAVKGHFDADMHFPDLVNSFGSRLHTLISPVASGQGAMSEVESTWQFLRAAVERLSASEVKGLQAIAQQLMPLCTNLEQRMSQQAEQVFTGWDIVDNFDICQDTPPVAALINYLGVLENSEKYLKSSQKVRDQISFASAVSKIQQKVSGIDKEAMWMECKATPSKGQSKNEMRMVVALLNLQRLAKDRPETGAVEARDALVEFVQRRLRTLQDKTITQFNRVMDSAIAVVGTERTQELKAINRQLEESTRVRNVLKAVWELFPDQDQDDNKVVELMKSTASKMHADYLQRDVLDIDKMAAHLVSVFEVASAVSSDQVRTHVNQIIGGYLKQLFQKKAVDFCDLAQALCDQGPLGGQIVDDFEQFRQYKLDRIRTKTAGMTFEHALQQLTELNPRITLPSRQNLESAFATYTSRYEGLLDEFMFSGPDALHKQVSSDIAAARSGRGRSVPELLAGICAAVSLEMSAERQSRKENMMHPHPVQVLALLRLLQVDSPASQRGRSVDGWTLDQSHLIQICTGEGKSIVLGVLSIFLALFGFDVDCVCYSTYLSVRDYRAFSGLFQSFGVKEKICYGTFGELARRHVNQHGDVREFTQSLFEGGAASVTSKVQQSKPAARGKILLIDEVDVFFSRDFYGALYCPSVLHKSPEVTELLRFIWQGRGQAMSFERVQGSPVYKKLEARYFPKLKNLIDAQIRALLHATTTYTAPEHAYEVTEDGRIGYVEHGAVNTSLMHGYNTTFCYFKEHERGTVDRNAFEDILGLNICCGRFSYAEIPLVYTQMLGVTGTLSSLGVFEESIIKDVYHIQGKTLMPSMYGRRDANFNQGVHVEKGKGGYHRKIQDEINYIVSAERAALVFFENEERLQEFTSSEYGQRLKDTASVVTTGSNTEVDHYVKQATRSREVTLFTRVFGRGLDFVCFDKTVMARGGVAVIQTFLSEDIAEEIQIMGRTCRQGERGTYKMILLAEDLLQWSASKHKQGDEGGGPPPASPGTTSPVRRQSLNRPTEEKKRTSFSVDLAALDDEIDLMALDDEASSAPRGVGSPMEYDLTAIEEHEETKPRVPYTPPPRKASIQPAKESFISMQELESMQAAGGQELYKVLDQRRRAWFTKESQERARAVDKAKKAHARSVEFQTNMVNIGQPGAAEKVISFLQSVNAGVPGGSGTSYHTVFCLDESFSMDGPRWEQLNQAFNQFLCTRTEESGAQDIISVVQFATEARVTLACASLAEAMRFNLEMKKGATFFRPPLQYALQLIQQARDTHPALMPLLIFMSDGENKDGDPSEMMRTMFGGIKGLIFHTVFFGNMGDDGCDGLCHMAQAIPGGKFHLSSDDGQALELVSTFQGIAAGITAL